MIDGSRLPLIKNIRETGKIVKIAHEADVPVEAELGAVMGHEAGPLPPYEELFASAKGFTSPTEAKRFVEETQADWLSVAIGNIHGAISGAGKEKKQEARLSVAHLKNESGNDKYSVGTSWRDRHPKEYLVDSFKNGIAKINIGTAIRQPYERLMHKSVREAQEAVYKEMLDIIGVQLEIGGPP
jgi:fructose/tagatose bisphosphate aldolase